MAITKNNKSKKKAKPAAKQLANKSVNFERKKTAEEHAQHWGDKTRVFTVTSLSIFSQLGGVFFLIGSLYLAHLEAINAAELIPRDFQYAMSLGLSTMSIMFSIIGFMFLTRWMTYRKMEVAFPEEMEDDLVSKGPEGEKVFNIAMNQIRAGVKFSGGIAVVFLLGNLLCSGLTVAAVISVLDTATTPISVWIYTLSISILALFAGACITMISAPDMDIEHISNAALAEYAKYCRLGNTINNLENFQ